MTVVFIDKLHRTRQIWQVENEQYLPRDDHVTQRQREAGPTHLNGIKKHSTTHTYTHTHIHSTTVWRPPNRSLTTSGLADYEDKKTTKNAHKRNSNFVKYTCESCQWSATAATPAPWCSCNKSDSFEKSSGKADDGSCVLHVTLAFHVLTVSETGCTLLGCANHRRKTITIRGRNKKLWLEQKLQTKLTA